MGCCVPEPKVTRRALHSPRSARSTGNLLSPSPRPTDEALMGIHHDAILTHLTGGVKETMSEVELKKTLNLIFDEYDKNKDDRLDDEELRDMLNAIY